MEMDMDIDLYIDMNMDKTRDTDTERDVLIILYRIIAKKLNPISDIMSDSALFSPI
jgi:hypothetical protein